MISLKTAYSLRKQIYDSGYHFLFVFFLIIPLFGYFMIFMLRLVYQLESPPRSPFYLLKYSIYFMILFVTSLPFFTYGECVISFTNWSGRWLFLRWNAKTNRIYSVRFYLFCIFVLSSRSL